MFGSVQNHKAYVVPIHHHSSNKIHQENIIPKKCVVISLHIPSSFMKGTAVKQEGKHIFCLMNDDGLEPHRPCNILLVSRAGKKYGFLLMQSTVRKMMKR